MQEKEKKIKKKKSTQLYLKKKVNNCTNKIGKNAKLTL